MTRENILEKLKEISSMLQQDEATKITAKSREEELKKLNEQRELLNFQIKELDAKLNDDNNYLSYTYIRNQSRIYDINYNLSKVNANIIQNENEILENDHRIEYINREIEACNALLSEAQRDLDKHNFDLRSLGESPSSEQEQEVMAKLVSAREMVEYLKNELDSFSAELEELTSGKDNLLNRRESLIKTQERNQKLLDSANLRELKESKAPIDVVKKNADERKLLQLQSAVESINNREAYVSFDFPIEIDSLIENIENNRIDDETILLRLQEFKTLLPEKLANRDYTNSEDELAENQRLQAEILMEKTALQEKLTDENNYLPSIYAVEVMDQEISTSYQTINKYNADIKNIDVSLARYDASKANIENEIQKAENEKNTKNKELYNIMLKEAVLPSNLYEAQKGDITKEKKKIQKEISDLDKKIERLIKTSLSIDVTALLAKRNKKDLEVLKNNETKILETREKTLEDRKLIDKMAITLDREKLASLNAQLAILKMREKSIYYDYEESLNELISGIKKTTSNELETKEELVEAPITSLNLEDDTFDNSNISKSFTADSPQEKMDTEIEDDMQPVPIYLWKKAKDKVLKKIHDTTFMRKLKALVAAGIVALSIGVGIKLGTNKNVNSKESEEIVEIIDTPEQSDVSNSSDIPDIEDFENNEVNVNVGTLDKSVDELAQEVIRGDWGNWPYRKEALTEAGYDYSEVQSKVNEIIKNLNQQGNLNGNDNTVYEPTPEPVPEPTPTPEPIPEPVPELTPTPEPMPEPVPSNKVVQEVEPGEIGILQTGDNNVAITNNAMPMDGKHNSISQQVSQGIIDNLEKHNVNVNSYMDDPTLTSSIIGDAGVTTNTYEGIINNGDYTVSDAVDGFVQQAYGENSQELNDALQGLNDLALNELGGKSR